jgi:methylase of polypeptide subunit release factors
MDERMRAVLENYDEQWFSPLVSQFGSERPSVFALTLTKTLPIEPNRTRFLDLGCGPGRIGIDAAANKNAKHVTFVDVRPEWIEITRENVAEKIARGVIDEQRITIMDACSFRELPADVINKHDLMAFNPPQAPGGYMETSAVEDIRGSAVKAAYRWGGLDGLETVRDFFGWYSDGTIPKPAAIMVLSTFLRRSLLKETIASFQLRAEILAETRVPLRPAFWKSAAKLSSDELDDRSLLFVGGRWTKVLLTHRFTQR